MSSQGFFQHGEKTRATKGHGEESPSPDKAPQAILQPRRMEVEQQPDRKTAHTQVSLQLHVMYRQQCRDRFDFQDNSFVHQDIGSEAKRQRLTFVYRRNPNFAPYPNATAPMRDSSAA